MKMSEFVYRNVGVSKRIHGNVGVFEFRVEMWLYTNLHIEMWACLNSYAGNVGVPLSSYFELRAYSNSYAEMWVRLLVYKRKCGCVFVF